MATTKSGKAIFVGEYSRPMDDKRRLTFPSKWRFSGDDEDTAYLALPNPNGSIILYPPAMVEQVYEKVSQTGMANQARQRVLTKIFRAGESVGCDKQGRISLSEKLVAHAGIKKDTVLTGNLTNIQIWEPERLRKWSEEGDDGGESLNDVLTELGL
ncbi:MAG: mraZ [Opitutales bacterium]|nr:mraZ [Opitutales bacterium]